MFSIIGSVHNTSEFGDTAKLFEAINEEELKKTLLRAELDERKMRRHALLSTAEQYTKVGTTPDGGDVLYDPATKQVKVVPKAAADDTDAEVEKYLKAYTG